MDSNRHPALTALLGMLLALQLDAANDDLLITRQWLTRDGLPQNSVLTIAEGSDGYLWLGTFDGLVRFDGVRFTTYAPIDYPELGGASIGVLRSFSDGNLWICSDGGLSCMRQGRFHRIPLETVTEEPIANSIIELASGAALVCSESQLIVIDNDRPTVVAEAPPRLHPLTTLGRGPQDRVYLYGGDLVVEIPATVDGLKDFDLFTAPPFETVDAFPIWTQTWDGVRPAPDHIVAQSTEMIHRWPFTSTIRLRASSTMEESFYFWASYHQPLRVFFQGDSWLHFSPPIRDYPDLAAAAPDSSGNLWIGLDGGGLLRLRRRSATTLSKRDGLRSNNIMTMTQDHQGQVWAGAVGSAGGLTWIDPETMETQFNGDGWPNGLLISSLLSSRSGVVWVGGALSGLHVYENEVFTPVAAPPGVHAFDAQTAITALFEDSRNRLWVGTRQTGLALLDGPRSRDFQTQHGLTHDRVTGISETPDGTIWVGTIRGLNAISPSGSIDHYDSESGLPVDRIHCVFTDSRGRLMIGSVGGGLTVRVGESFVNLRMKDGLIDDIIAQIIEDDHGVIWVAGNRGIARLDPVSFENFLTGDTHFVRADSFGSEEGMINEECGGGYQPATIKTPDGQLWFSTVGGIVRIDPKDFAAPKSPPRVNVEEITVDEREEIPTVAGSASVPPGARNLKVEYTGIDFRAPEDLAFRYRLVPFDHDWVEAGKRRAAFYTGVPPGNYRFEVIARGSGGEWSLDPAVVNLQIAPTWWQSTFFRGLAFGSAVSALYAAYWLRTRSSRRHKLLKERFSRELVELQEKERAHLATELHDGLGQNLMVIKRQVTMALDAPPSEQRATRRLEQIAEAANLAVDDVRAMARKLRPYELDRLGLTQAIESVAQRIADTQNLQLQLDLQPIDMPLKPQVETHIFRIVQESLSNVAKHSDATRVSVSVKRRDRFLFFTVSDNGKGVKDTTDALNSGLGVINMSERARWIGAELQFTSRPRNGLRVTLRTPLNETTLQGA